MKHEDFYQQYAQLQSRIAFYELSICDKEKDIALDRKAIIEAQQEINELRAKYAIQETEEAL